MESWTRRPYIGGRLKKASMSQRVKHPVVLPKFHHIVDLTINHCGQCGELTIKSSWVRFPSTPLSQNSLEDILNPVGTSRLSNDSVDPAKTWSDLGNSGPSPIRTACPQPRPAQWHRMCRRHAETLGVHMQESAMQTLDSVDAACGWR